MNATMIDLTPRLDNRRKSAVKFLLLVVAAGKSSLSPFLGMQGVGEEGVPFRELSTQHLILSTELLIADFAFYF